MVIEMNLLPRKQLMLMVVIMVHLRIGLIHFPFSFLSLGLRPVRTLDAVFGKQNFYKTNVDYFS